MVNIKKTGYRLVKSIARDNEAVEDFFRRNYRQVRRTIDVNIGRKRVEKKSFVLWSKKPYTQSVGVYMKGGCDLGNVWKAIPYIHPRITGSWGVYQEGRAGGARSDVILQSLQQWDAEQIGPATEEFHLSADYFKPRLFEPTFTIPGIDGDEQFPKSVIVLSIGPDVARNIYQHRKHGFLVDPGAWWLEKSMEQVLDNLDAIKWFRKNFIGRGRMKIGTFYDNYRKLIPALKEKTGAPVIVLNTFELAPGSKVHNYQFDKNSEEKRRREFNLALYDLAQELDFNIVDVDRIVKTHGVSEAQLDFMHFAPAIRPLIGQEVFRIIWDLIPQPVPFD